MFSIPKPYTIHVKRIGDQFKLQSNVPSLSALCRMPLFNR